MLNMTSAYYVDQLAEKLQLMLATGELKIGSWMRQQGLTDDVYHFAVNFELDAPSWIVKVEYYAESSQLDFNKLIQLLAEKLANRANHDLRKFLAQANAPLEPVRK